MAILKSFNGRNSHTLHLNHNRRYRKCAASEAAITRESC